MLKLVLPNDTANVNSKVMSEERNRAKMALFILWVKAGPTKVFFDSGYPGVKILDRLKNDPEMWIALTEARVTSSGMAADIRPPEGEPFEVCVPWPAIHTMESAHYREIHVWADDLEAAEKRKNDGYRKEMKN